MFYSKNSLPLFIIGLFIILSAMPVHAKSKLNASANIPTGYYILVPEYTSTRALTINGGSTKSGAKVYSYKYNLKDSQVFRIGNLGNGVYQIKNKKSYNNLYARGKKAANSSVLCQKTPGSSKRQKWYIAKQGNSYVIQNCYNLNVITIKGNSKANKAQIITKKYNKQKGQRWKLIPYNSASKTTNTTTGVATSAKTASASFATASNASGIDSIVWNDSKHYDVLTNIIGAVESGGQIYGKRDYSAYCGPYAASPIEYTITIGWAQFYGDEAQELVSRIIKKAPAEYAKLDPKGLIKKALTKNWEINHWNPTATEKQIIIKLITTETGKKLQDEYFKELTKPIVEYCKKTYTNKAAAVIMYVQIRHLGGPAAAKKIFDKCNKNYSLTNIMAKLDEDKQDKTSDNQVGDAKFTTRHQKVIEFVKAYC